MEVESAVDPEFRGRLAREVSRAVVARRSGVASAEHLLVGVPSHSLLPVRPLALVLIRASLVLRPVRRIPFVVLIYTLL